MERDRYQASMERAERVLKNMAERTPEAQAAAARERGRWARSVARRAARITVALGGWFLAVLLFALFVSPIGIMGGLAAILVAVALITFLAIWPRDRVEDAAAEKLNPRELVHRLDAKLHRTRGLLPAPAQARVDAISAQLPLLESRLVELDPLDPLAQDARRLMGAHLPDLIDRYERVPTAYRREADAGGLSVEDRLMTGLDAARTAIDEISEKLARGDIQALETHGRFIESRYSSGQLPENSA